MTRVELLLGRVAIAALLVLALLVQVAVPGWATDFATRNPEVTHLVVPYSLAAVAFIVCGEVMLLAVWRLLSLARSSAIRTRRGVRWIDVIIGCALAATGLTAAVIVHLIRFAPGGGGPTVYLLGAGIVCGMILVVLMVIRRARLASAVAGRPETVI